jgi:hypothetical protein
MSPKGFVANQQATIVQVRIGVQGVISKDDNKLARGA